MAINRIACVQMAPVLGDLKANLAASTAAIAGAVAGGAQIVVTRFSVIASSNGFAWKRPRLAMNTVAPAIQGAKTQL